MLTQTHPVYTTYRSLFTGFLVLVSFNHSWFEWFKFKHIQNMFIFDTILMLYPPLYRFDLVLHHLVNILFIRVWLMNDLGRELGLYIVRAELVSIFNFLRKSNPRLVVCWRVGTILFIRIPAWVWLYSMGHPLTITMCVFFCCYDAFLLKQLAPQVKRLVFKAQ